MTTTKPKATIRTITADDAKKLLGWELVAKDAKDFLFKDTDGNKVKLTKNTTNRPFRMPLASRYRSEMLRKKWRLNGESLVFDHHNNCQSGQHRLVALVLAEQLRQADPNKYRDKHNLRGPISIEAVLVTGISNKRDVIDTIDLGQKRQLSDVLYRRGEFKGSNQEQRKLAGILSGATRLAWLRSGGLKISDAPHFPHSEALDFLQEHPGLHDAVKFIVQEEGGNGADGKRISSFLSLGHAAGLLYLMGVSATDPDKYREVGPDALSIKLWNKAEEFWTLFAGGADVEPVKHLGRVLLSIDGGGASGRDEQCGTIIKAFNRWIDGNKGTGKDIKVRRKKNDEGRMILAEHPRLGGLDVEIEFDPEPETPSPNKRKGSKSKGGWKPGDTAWVKDPDGEHWFGTVTSLADDGKTIYLTDDADKEWEVKIADLTDIRDWDIG